MNFTRYKPCQLSEKVLRLPPKSIDGCLPDVFQREAEVYSDTPESGIYIVKNGIAFSGGDCYTSWGGCIHWNNESLPVNSPRSRKYWSVKPWLISKQHISGTVAVLVHPQQNGYFHWLFDVLPRLALIEKSGLKPDYIYISQDLPFQRESLSFLGNKYEILNANHISAISAEYLLIPSAPSVSGVMCPWICDFLRQNLDKATAKLTIDAREVPERIYISRKKAKHGKLTNEEEVQEFLEGHGFQTICTEDLSFLEQINLFQSAKVVVGTHGAGFSNLVFSSRDTQLVEIFSPDYLNVCYWTLCSQVGIRYSFVIGESSFTDSRYRPNIYLETSKLNYIALN